MFSIHQKSISWFPQKILSSTTDFNIDRNVSWAANQYIRMISEGSCDTEDWRWCWKFSFASQE